MLIRAASRSFWEVLDALVHLVPELLRVDLLQREESQKFFAEKGLPVVLGCVDGTRVRIQAPSQNEEEYLNRKGYHSLNVQIVSTGYLLIANCVAKWPGGTHDSRILSESTFPIEIAKLNDSRKSIILGDEGYGLRTWLFTPVAETGNLTDAERR